MYVDIKQEIFTNLKHNQFQNNVDYLRVVSCYVLV